MIPKEKSMPNTSNQTPSTAQDVIDYLHDAVTKMRAYPLESDFEKGYEKGVTHVMYHLLGASAGTERFGSHGVRNTVMSSATRETLATVQDVVEYLFGTLYDMRAFPLEDGDFQLGWERAFHDVMYYLQSCIERVEDNRTLH
jgi:hypothetical protein